MNRRFTILVIISILPLVLFAQRRGGRFEEYLEKYKAERVSYLTQKLDLSVEQAEKFWPVYNEYQSKREELMGWRRTRRHWQGADSLSVAQMEEIMDMKIQSELKLAELAATYHKKFKEILPVEKVFILYRAEQDFMGHMVNKLQQNRRNRGSRGGVK